MCDQCDYPDLLEDSGLGYTPNRLRILEIIGDSRHPPSALEIVERLNQDPFVFTKQNKPVPTSYYKAPDQTFQESPGGYP